MSSIHPHFSHSDNAYQPSDQWLPESCTAYRHPESGYQPQKNNGTCSIKPPNAPKKYKAYCDQKYDEGGFLSLGEGEGKTFRTAPSRVA
ncbi:hypothetical protein L6R29_07380 [Myxococcota bacterium]|nr:hypothetical protein [Myxococcota bacterium]